MYGTLRAANAPPCLPTLTLTQIHAATVILCRPRVSVLRSLGCSNAGQVLSYHPGFTRLVTWPGGVAASTLHCHSDTRHTASILIRRLPSSALPALHSRITSVTHSPTMDHYVRPTIGPSTTVLYALIFVIGSDGHFDGDFSKRACVARNSTAPLPSLGNERQSEAIEARTLGESQPSKGPPAAHHSSRRWLNFESLQWHRHRGHW